MQTNVIEVVKKKPLWLIVVCVLVLLGIVYFIGHSIGHSEGLTDATVKIDKQKYNYDKLVAAVKNKQQHLSTINEDISALSKEQEELSDELSNAKEAISKKVSAENELSTLKSDIDSRRNEITELNDELSSLQGKIKETKEKPIILPAGQFTVGKDIQAGRYKVVAAGRGGNLFVYDSLGNNLVNTIIYSDKSNGETEYVTNLDDDYVIDAHYSFKFIPVE
ncbi:hypothetical protein [Niallia sp. 03133]|uniref:hypothetical protein n=1 Tax=Niallia sp. 03133 TaxID=3458060 RepID=UPI004044B09A